MNQDQILYWNEVALEANRVSHTNGKNEQTGPPLSARALAIIHLAMYDAYAGVVDDPVNFPAYLPALPIPVPGSSVDEAIAGAAYTTLTALFPSQKAFFDTKFSEAGLPGGLHAGHAFGVTVANAMLADRMHDPNADDAGYFPSMARGKHRPDPDNPGQGIHAPFYGANSKGFAVSARHEIDKPPQPGDPEYLKALKEVRAKGIAPELSGTLPMNFKGRTVDETLIGIYWGYDGSAGLGTPPRFYNAIVRTVAMAKNNSIGDNARLFALVHAAMADAGILAWDQKYIHDLWRPILGIREHDVSMGPTGTGRHNISDDCDPAWLPLGAPATNSFKTVGVTDHGEQFTVFSYKKNFTPPFPAYPSGHATFGAAALHMTRLFYGISPGDRNPDTLFNTLTLVSNEFDGTNKDNKGTVRPKHVRKFPNGLWQMIEENGRSRVFLGVHWVFDAFAVDNAGHPDLLQNKGGVKLGLTIAEDIFAGNQRAPKKSNVMPR